MGQENRQIDSLNPAQADVCTSNELARRLGLHIATIRALADDDAIPGRLPGEPPRFSWRVVYESIAGSGTADGQVVSLRGLAQRYRVTPRKVRDACAEGRLRGAKIGGKWLFAVNAVPAKLPPHQRKKISAATLAVSELHVAVVKERQLAAARALDIFPDHCAAFSPAQAEAARLLNRNPGMSPAQLAAMADPPCSAQAMEHRLIRLVSTVRKSESLNEQSLLRRMPDVQGQAD